MYSKSSLITLITIQEKELEYKKKLKKHEKTHKKGGCQVNLVYLAFIMKKLLINQLL